MAGKSIEVLLLVIIMMELNLHNLEVFVDITKFK